LYRKPFLLVLVGSLLLVVAPAPAQTSASYDLEEHTINAGGNPNGGVVPMSASFRISLDSIGEGFSALAARSSSYAMDSCFSSAYPPPQEVENLRFAESKTMLFWDSERSVGDYSLYRGLLSTIAGLDYGCCEQKCVANEEASDLDSPPVGEGFLYLVSARNRLYEEGTKGFRELDGNSMTQEQEREGTLCLAGCTAAEPVCP
jgi:hypothetical protein